MKRLLFLGLLLVLVGCTSNAVEDKTSNVIEADWSDNLKDAQGTEVSIFMWGGDNGINTYIDEWIAPRLKEQFDITLKRYPMDANDFISKLMTEKKAGKKEGTIDIIWVNGENFKNAKNNDLLLGSFAPKLPNLQEYIGEQPFVHSDMGTAIDGLEAPWGKVQFVLNYDSAKVSNPPTNFIELIQWTRDNPGQFTYPNVNDFTGNAFVRQLLYEVAGSEASEITTMYNEEWLENSNPLVWQVLKDMKSSLWREGKTYPESLSQLDQLYSKGEVAFTMGFNEKRIESLIRDGVFPETTKSLILEPGSIGNTHYLSIPFNSPNPAGAMVAINYLLSPEAQIVKMDPNFWGEDTVLDRTKLTKEQLEHLEKVAGTSVISSNQILPELDSRYADWIKEHWENEVVQN
jgi:putative spermidine/putrescine transport system substrate-binding protein